MGVGLWTPCQQAALTVDLDLPLASAKGVRSLWPWAVAEAPPWLFLKAQSVGFGPRGFILRVGAACLSGEMLAPECQWSIKDHLAKAVASSKEIRCHHEASLTSNRNNWN